MLCSYWKSNNANKKINVLSLSWHYHIIRKMPRYLNIVLNTVHRLWCTSKMQFHFGNVSIIHHMLITFRHLDLMPHISTPYCKMDNRWCSNSYFQRVFPIMRLCFVRETPSVGTRPFRKYHLSTSILVFREGIISKMTTWASVGMLMSMLHQDIPGLAWQWWIKPSWRFAEVKRQCCELKVSLDILQVYV